MKKIGLALSVFALIWMGISALHLTNPYLRSAEFIEVNGLSPDGAVAAGRRLRVPVLEPAEQLQAMAEHKALDTAARAPYNDVTD